MEKYTIYCTEEQTKKALELGAPIENYPMYMYDRNDVQKYIYRNEYNIEVFSYCPTAEQMIGWLEEKVDSVDVFKRNCGTWLYIFYPSNGNDHECGNEFRTRKEATLAAIDAAFEYLNNQKQKL